MKSCPVKASRPKRRRTSPLSIVTAPRPSGSGPFQADSVSPVAPNRQNHASTISEARRTGNEWDSTRRSRRWQEEQKKKRSDRNRRQVSITDPNQTKS